MTYFGANCYIQIPQHKRKKPQNVFLYTARNRYARNKFLARVYRPSDLFFLSIKTRMLEACGLQLDACFLLLLHLDCSLNLNHPREE